MSLFDLAGKVAVITGSTKGIGLGIARELLAQHANVIISGRNQVSCDGVAYELNVRYRAGGQAARGVVFDLSRREEIDRFAEDCRSAFGGIDILVCNASMLPVPGPAPAIPPDIFDQMLSTNIHHNFRLCEALRPDIARRGGGSITLIGSLAGHNASPNMLAYAVSKAGVSHLAVCLAGEMAAQNIRVNCIAPGFIRSFSSQRVIDNAPVLASIVQSIPLSRIGEPEDIGGTVVFLASRAGSYITGETILVDGGRTCLASLAAPVQAAPLSSHAV